MFKSIAMAKKEPSLPLRESGRRRFCLHLILILALSVFSSSLLIFLTHVNGIGLSPDSAHYLSSSRNLLETGTLATGVVGWDHDPQSDAGPLVHYPPAFPAILALIEAMGTTEAAAARWFNIILLALNLLLVGLTVLYVTKNSLIALTAVAAASISADSFVFLHAVALTEPLYTLLLLLFLLSFTAFLGRRQLWLLVVAAILASLGTLARYVGVSIGLAALAVFLLLRDEPLRRRLRFAGSFSLIFLLPLIWWFGRNALLAERLTGRRTSFYGIDPENIQSGLATVIDWLIPVRYLLPHPMPAHLKLVVFSLFLGVLAVIAWLLWPLRRSSPPRSCSASHALTALCSLALSYLFVLLVSLALIDPSIPLNPRILSPLYVCALIALPLSLVPSPGVLFSSRRAKLALGLASVWTILTIGNYVHLSRDRARGYGYASPSCRASEMISWLRQEHDHHAIYSTHPDAIYLLADRPSRYLPNDASPRTLETLRRIIKSRPTLFVFFKDMPWGDLRPVPEGLADSLRLTPSKTANDGIAYRPALDQNCAPGSSFEYQSR